MTLHLALLLEWQRTRGENVLSYDPSAAKGGERTILGGLKTKNVDVVVTKNGIGPVLAVSCKGVTGAFRNLSNRMEETVGECTNLHITYPAMVVGYFAVLRANRQIAASATTAVASPETLSRQLTANDLAFRADGEVVEAIVRFHAALREMTAAAGIPITGPIRTTATTPEIADNADAPVLHPDEPEPARPVLEPAVGY
jgi:hypothetical protein